ncbi:MAG: NTP transferase domain-containing protein [candidate division WOR-3 bacterium]|nr:MAG: NTP transferase domain-containing protein [candidate division WOR-3 bacterium]
MNIIIPVAGEGTRLRPLTHTTPKSLLYVAGKPILGHILDSFLKLPVKKLVIVLGAQAKAIIEFCRRYPFRTEYVYQKKRLGLGHAIYTGARGLTGRTMVLLGDTIIDCNYRRFTSSAENLLAVKAVDDPQRFGVVETRGRKVTGLVEKPSHPKSNLAITGLYLFQNIEKVRRAIALLMKKGRKTRGEYQLTDGLKYLHEQGEDFRTFKIDKWYDCGTAAALIQTNRFLLKKMHHSKPRKRTIIIPPVFIDDSARIENALIGPYVSIAEHAVVKNALVHDSIINREAAIENALVAESIVGNGSRVTGGFKKLNVSDSSLVEIP